MFKHFVRISNCFGHNGGHFVLISNGFGQNAHQTERHWVTEQRATIGILNTFGTPAPTVQMAAH